MRDDPTNIIARVGDPITSWSELAPFISLGIERGDEIGRHIAMTYLRSMAEVADQAGPIAVDAGKQRVELVDPIKGLVDTLIVIAQMEGSRRSPKSLEVARMAKQALADYQRAVSPS